MSERNDCDDIDESNGIERQAGICFCNDNGDDHHDEGAWCTRIISIDISIDIDLIDSALMHIIYDSRRRCERRLERGRAREPASNGKDDGGKDKKGETGHRTRGTRA
jgi:hypothetical protein